MKSEVKILSNQKLQENKPNSFEMTELKASIISSDLTRNVVKIKVLFESKQKTVIKKKSVAFKSLDYCSKEHILDTTEKVVHFGWKKEAIPVFKFKKSLIARFFEAIFG